jgi:hypothetical protein
MSEFRAVEKASDATFPPLEKFEQLAIEWRRRNWYLRQLRRVEPRETVVALDLARIFDFDSVYARGIPWQPHADNVVASWNRGEPEFTPFVCALHVLWAIQHYFGANEDHSRIGKHSPEEC